MDAHNKKLIIKKVIYIINDKITPFEDLNDSDKLVSSKNLSFLVKDYKKCYEDIIFEILVKNGWEKKFSEKYVEKFIDNLISYIIKEGVEKVRLNPELGFSIFDDYFQNVVVYVPIHGIELKVDKLVIGKVALRKMTDKNADELAYKIASIFKKNPHYKSKVKNDIIKDQRNRILKFRNKTYAKIIFFADEKTAINLAEKELESVLDVLTYSLSFLYPKDHNVTVGLGEIKREIRSLMVFKSNFYSWLFNDNLVGPLTYFEISQEKINKMRKIGVFELSKILKNNNQDLTEFENMLLMGIHWFADSQKQLLDENEFMCLSNCMELFLKPNSGSISSFLANGIVEILKYRPEHKNYMKKRVKQFYDTRSDITHGRIKKLNKKDLEKELKELRNLIKNLLRILIKRKDEFKNKKSLLEWIELSSFPRYNENYMFPIILAQN